MRPKKVAALTETTLTADAGAAGFKPDGEFTTDGEGENMTYTVTMKFDRFELVHTASITMPNHEGKIEGAKAKMEWARFVAALYAHEVTHVGMSIKESQAICDEIGALRATATAATKRDAAMLAAKQLLVEFKKIKNDVSKRLTSVHKKLDKSSGHGPTLKYNAA
jgi:hypothetical protein